MLICAFRDRVVFLLSERYDAQLILPYLQLDIKYYDLGIEHRDAVGTIYCNALCTP